MVNHFFWLLDREGGAPAEAIMCSVGCVGGRINFISAPLFQGVRDRQRAQGGKPRARLPGRQAYEVELE